VLAGGGCQAPRDEDDAAGRQRDIGDVADEPPVVVDEVDHAALLDLGADPNAPNAKGRTPLAIATSAGFDETAALLKAKGAR
jgi:ankyrin repeat protein